MTLVVESFVDEQIKALAEISDLDDPIEDIFRTTLESVTKNYFIQHGMCE
jgi:hypothetical protein